ncbi:probable calcium-binding protein CML17 [Phoenix dactylifera]|uniref:Probable calcium-binding protein CML17 n=1 Tax=Phoenix dactylifera TaxID=42345 RepID=A0A8B7C2Z2_PHODC|nr:probable calcium-binding protein CML17 [Phoenix dactylifera]
MKLSIGTIFGSYKKPSKKKSRSISRSDASTATSFSSEDSTSSRLRYTPRSVLPPSSGKNPSAAGSDDLCFLSSASSSVSDLFAVFDRDGDGKITRHELQAVLRRLGGADPPTEEEVASMVAEVDRDGDGCISLEEFGAIGSAFGPPAGADLREAFAVFDADGDGKISAEELLGVFITLGDEGCTLEDCRRMIGGVDTDGDGFVCFEDFVRMMDGQR